MTDTTHIFFVLDRSGSMRSCRSDTIGGFNTFLEDQQRSKVDEGFFSLYQFDHEYLTVHENVPLADVPPLTLETFVPRGRTALLDAIGRTLKNIDRLKPTGKVIVVILTDGDENESREYTYAHIADLVTERKARGYEFIFLGANQDAIATASRLSISGGAALTFNTSRMEAVCGVLSEAITKTRVDKTCLTSFGDADRLKST